MTTVVICVCLVLMSIVRCAAELTSFLFWDISICHIERNKHTSMSCRRKCNVDCNQTAHHCHQHSHDDTRSDSVSKRTQIAPCKGILSLLPLEESITGQQTRGGGRHNASGLRSRRLSQIHNQRGNKKKKKIRT
jgi:hypothetical protein